MSRLHLSRRTLLRGLGTLLALPTLEAMLPGVAQAQSMARPKRFVAFYVPCGIRMNRWTPAATGASWTPSSILQPIGAYDGQASIIPDTLVLTGLANRPARPDGPGDHASGTGAFITVAHPFKTNGANISNGISFDQVLANAWRGQTRFSSLELGVDGGGASGDCDSGYSCAYARNIAWASATQPLAKETNPQAVFDRLFAGVDPNQTAAAVAKRKLYRQSVLDAVKEDTVALQGKVGATDKRKLDEYFTGVRELEVRIAAEQPSTCAPGARPTQWTDIRSHSDQMIDLIAFAFQCDLTRSVTFMQQNAGSGYVYRFLTVNGSAITEGHHSLSHHGGDVSKNDQLEAIGRWEVGQFAKLARKLKAIQEPDGTTVLDNSALFFSSEIEDGDSHSHFNMPILVAGKAGGALRTGQHLRYPDQPSVGNLFVSLAGALGVNTTQFGDSTGALQGIRT
ncbi:MAG TPA: DUF1552 domain-containing protein [Archangium sp.]